MEKLTEELQAYQLRNPSNVIEEVVLVGEKNGLLKKLLKLAFSPQENLAFVVDRKINLSRRKYLRKSLATNIKKIKQT